MLLYSTMLIYTLICLLISNAITMVQEKAVLYSRFAITGLLSVLCTTYNNLYINFLGSGLGLYNGLFNVSIFTQSFNLFVLLLSILIGILTAIYPNKLINLTSSKGPIYSNNPLTLSNKEIENISDTIKLGKQSEQFTIIEYALITLFILSGAMFLMSTGDLISLFLSIELQSYGLYILATLYRNSESATSSGLTYFLLGGLSSCFILLGSAILYVNSGTTNLDNMYVLNSIVGTNMIDSVESLVPYNNYTIYEMGYINLSLTILLVGFLFKISAAPFHFWSPDVYDGVPTIVTTFLAIIAKIALFTVLLEFINNFVNDYSSNAIELINNSDMYLGNSNEWKNIIIISSLISLIIGSLLGLTQHRIKRLFAYSTISHVGFILLSLSINKMESIQAYIFYILQYSLSNLNAFLLVIVIGYSLIGFKYDTSNKSEELEKTSEFIDKKNSPIQLLNQLNGYFYLNQFLCISLAITLFSFIGIPPLIGFFAKQMVLSAALDEGYVFITLVGVITSVIGAAYYLNIVKLMFFSKSKTTSSRSSLGFNNKSSIINVNDYLSVIISSLTMIVLLFIFIPSEWFRIVSILSLFVCKV